MGKILAGLTIASFMLVWYGGMQKSGPIVMTGFVLGVMFLFLAVARKFFGWLAR